MKNISEIVYQNDRASSKILHCSRYFILMNKSSMAYFGWALKWRATPDRKSGRISLGDVVYTSHGLSRFTLFNMIGLERCPKDNIDVMNVHYLRRYLVNKCNHRAVLYLSLPVGCTYSGYHIMKLSQGLGSQSSYILITLNDDVLDRRQKR